MADSFDPYRTWLGISPHEQPPHHYRLLGLSLFESDPATIAGAADRQMAHVRTFQAGPRGSFTQRILNELAAAKLCLLDRQAKATYDAALRAQFEAQAAQLAAAAAHPPAWRTGPPTLSTPVPPPLPPPPPAHPAIAPLAAASSPIHAAGSNGAPGSDEVRDGDPLYAQPWFPAAVLAGVALVLGGGWFVWNAATRTAEPPPIAEPEPAALPMPLPAEPNPPPATVTAAVQQQAPGGEISLPVAAAVLIADGGAISSPGEAIDLERTSDRLHWEFEVTRPGFFRVELTYAAGAEQAGGRYRVAVSLPRGSPIVRDAVIRDAGGADPLHDAPFLVAIPRGGKLALDLRPLEIRGGKLCTLHEVRLVLRQ